LIGIWYTHFSKHIEKLVLNEEQVQETKKMHKKYRSMKTADCTVHTLAVARSIRLGMPWLDPI